MKEHLIEIETPISPRNLDKGLDKFLSRFSKVSYESSCRIEDSMGCFFFVSDSNYYGHVICGPAFSTYDPIEDESTSAIEASSREKSVKRHDPFEGSEGQTFPDFWAVLRAPEYH